MRKWLLAIAACLGLTAAAHGETASAVVVSACGSPPQTYVAGQPYPLTIDTNGNLCLGGSSSSPSPTPGQ